jgi:hypothetical protein
MKKKLISESTIGRRSFMKQLGMAGVAALPAGALLTSQSRARADDRDDGRGGRLNDGDVAILRFLALAEILEMDLWQQYNELALGNESYQLALNILDGDEATYVDLNTRDEISHASFLNGYLMSKGQKAVSLEQFRRLPSS